MRYDVGLMGLELGSQTATETASGRGSSDLWKWRADFSL
jgi:hypothetical protein